MRYRLEIALLSAASPGSGEGWAGMIDSDVVFDEFGLPYIPGRRLRGLLRESAYDVLGASSSFLDKFAAPLHETDIPDLFGYRGDEKAAPLVVENAYLENYREMQRWLKWAKRHFPEFMSTDSILATFTHLRQQTAIDNENGIAKQGSLRTTRVLHRGMKFVAELAIEAGESKYETLLALATQVTRNLGGKRNRGLGQVQCRLLRGTQDLTEGVVPIVENILAGKPATPLSSPVAVTPVIAEQREKKSETELRQLTYTVTVQAPVLITGSVGDENMAMSEDYLSGTALLGMFARRYLNQAKLETEAHLDQENFKPWFLGGELRFLNGYKTSASGLRALPIPLSLQFSKQEAGNASEAKPFEFLFRESNEDDKPKGPKHQDGYCILDEAGFELASVAKGFGFHHERTNQIAGRSEDGKIYNYEFIRSGQVFKAAIIGPEHELQRFRKFMGECKFIARLGRSKNTQYGRVEVDFEKAVIEEINELPKPFSREITMEPPCFSLTCLSHLILLNENGQAEVKAETLEKRLTEALRKHLPKSDEQAAFTLKVEKSFARAETIENYVAYWKARKPSQAAFQMGSCFLVRIESADPALRQSLSSALKLLEQHGLGMRRQEGFGRIAINWQRKPEDDEGFRNLTKSQREKSEEALEAALAFSAPETVKTILRQAWYAHLLRRARELGASRQLKFSPAQGTRGMMTGAAITHEKRKGTTDRLPPSTQLSRLAAFVANAKSENDFVESYLKKLRDTAKDKLRSCRNEEEGVTLLDFLENLRLTRAPLESNAETAAQSELYRNITSPEDEDEQELRAICGASPEVDENFKALLFKEYMTTFFVLMQKRNKVQEGQDGD